MKARKKTTRRHDKQNGQTALKVFERWVTQIGVPVAAEKTSKCENVAFYRHPRVVENTHTCHILDFASISLTTSTARDKNFVYT